MRRGRLAGFLVVAFALRLAFGLCSEFWMDDERQIYLIGLKYFTTGDWPYLGPDVVYTRSQVPGGLQGALIGWPFQVVAAPESPFVLLNLLSLGSLWLLTWYIGRRLPDVPRWFLWPLVFFAPWTLNFSTHVTNPSYVLTGGVLFFVAIFELLPSLRAGLVPRPLAWLMGGFSLLSVTQLHAVYCWRPFLQHPVGRAVAAALIVSGLVTHLAIAIDGFHRRSLSRDRALVVRALETRDYRILGERRPVLWDLERAGR